MDQERRIQCYEESFVEALKENLAGRDRRVIEHPSFAHAAVLVPLYEKDRDCYILFTRRTQQVRHHKGQISFPGGAREHTDADIVATALRETEEEIGLPRNAVRVLGVLDDFQTPSGFCMTPVVGYAATVPALHLHQGEVAGMFLAPLSFFLDGRNERMEQRERSGKLADIYFYHYHEYVIWGATAAILRSFLHAERTCRKSHDGAKTL